jgi:hypothetical protein
MNTEQLSSTTESIIDQALRILLEKYQEINHNDILNLHCFTYLYNLAQNYSNTECDQSAQDGQQILNLLGEIPNGFKLTVAYWDLYHKVHCIIMQNSLQLPKSFIKALFVNDNQSLSNTWKIVDHIQQKTILKLSDIPQRLSGQNGITKRNQMTPDYAGSKSGRFCSMLWAFHPSNTTSIATIRSYDYRVKSPVLPKELRFGTQGVYEQSLGKGATVNQLFQLWLKNQADELSTQQEKKISHIYFNSLAYHRLKGYEAEWETQISQALHALELSIKNVAVITFPADQGLLNASLLCDPQETIFYQKEYLRELIIAVATNNDLCLSKNNSLREFFIKDCYISDAVKQLLYGVAQNTLSCSMLQVIALDDYDKQQEKIKVEEFIDKTFQRLHMQDTDDLTMPQMMAAYFHFFKYEYSNFILEKINPLTFNMSCKDAIDRGGVHSAYYNIVKAKEYDLSLSTNEIITAIHSAPILVKARLMNHHLSLLMNVLKIFDQSLHDEIASGLGKPELIENFKSDYPSDNQDADYPSANLIDYTNHPQYFAFYGKQLNTDKVDDKVQYEDHEFYIVTLDDITNQERRSIDLSDNKESITENLAIHSTNISISQANNESNDHSLPLFYPAIMFFSLIAVTVCALIMLLLGLSPWIVGIAAIAAEALVLISIVAAKCCHMSHKENQTMGSQEQLNMPTNARAYA